MPVTTRQMKRVARQVVSADFIEDHVKVMNEALCFVRKVQASGTTTTKDHQKSTVYMAAFDRFARIPFIKRRYRTHTIVNNELIKWMQTIRS